MLVLSILTVVGCTSSSSTSDNNVNPTQTPTQTPTQVATPKPTVAPTPAPTQIPDMTFSGSKSQATEKFHLEKGLTIFHTKNVDDGQFPMNFIINLLDSNGKTVGLAANAIGTSDSATPMKIDKAGDYILDVTSFGSWNVVVEQPRYTTAQSVPVTLSGSGYGATQPFYLKSGLVRFESSNVDDSKFAMNFIVYLMDNQGNMVGLVANDIGTSTSSKAMSITSSGVYLLSVMSFGDWTIKVSQ